MTTPSMIDYGSHQAFLPQVTGIPPGSPNVNSRGPPEEKVLRMDQFPDVEPADAGDPVTVPVTGHRARPPPKVKSKLGFPAERESRSIQRLPRTMPIQVDPHRSSLRRPGCRRAGRRRSRSRGAGTVGVPEQPSVAPDHTDGVHPVAVPVADHRDIPGLPVLDRRDQGRPGLRPVVCTRSRLGAGDTMTGIAHHGHGAHPGVGEVTRDRIVTRRPEVEGLAGPPLLSQFRNCQVAPVSTAGQAG